MIKTAKTQELTGVSEDSIQMLLNRKATVKERISLILPYIGIMFLILFFTITTKGRFIEAKNLKLLLNQCFTMAVVVVGATFLYAMGNMDMGIGGVMSVSALVISALFLKGVPLLISLLSGIAVSCIFMSITALAKNYLGIMPFIASLCVMNISTGIVSVSTKVERTIFPYSKALWLDTTPAKIITLVFVIAIGYTFFKYTSFGKSLKAIGGNSTVAKISGIRIYHATTLAYIMSGVTIGIASLFAVVRGGVADVSIGSGMNLNVMIGLVLGGFPLSGGARSRFSAPIIGAMMVTVLTNGLALMGQANTIGYAIRGILLIIVVSMTYDKSDGELIT
jgi:ribose transport system permease protein